MRESRGISPPRAAREFPCTYAVRVSSEPKNGAVAGDGRPRATRTRLGGWVAVGCLFLQMSACASVPPPVSRTDDAPDDEAQAAPAAAAEEAPTAPATEEPVRPAYRAPAPAVVNPDDAAAAEAARRAKRRAAIRAAAAALSRAGGAMRGAAAQPAPTATPCSSDFSCTYGLRCIKHQFEASGYCAQVTDANGTPTLVPPAYQLSPSRQPAPMPVRYRLRRRLAVRQGVGHLRLVREVDGQRRPDQE